MRKRKYILDYDIFNAFADESVFESTRLNQELSRQHGQGFVHTVQVFVRTQLIFHAIVNNRPLLTRNTTYLENVLILVSKNVLDSGGADPNLVKRLFPKQDDFSLKKLSKLADAVSKKIIEKLRMSFVTLVADGWTGVNRYEEMGVIYSGRKFLLPKGLDLPGKNGFTIFCVLLLALKHAEKLKHKVTAMVLDNASANILARKLLKETKYSLLMLKCYAHQGNLIFKRVCDTELQDFMKFILSIAKKVRNTESFQRLLQQKCKERYGPKGPTTVQLVSSTRWSSYYIMLRSFLRIRGAFIQTRRAYEKSAHKGKSKLFCFLTNEFFNKVNEIVDILKPLVDASLVLRSTQSNVGDVVAMYLKIYDGFENLI